MRKESLRCNRIHKNYRFVTYLMKEKYIIFHVSNEMEVYR